MLPWLPDRTRGIGFFCPCCKVPGTPEYTPRNGLRYYHWICPVCGARGDATKSRTPARVMWHGVDMGKVPVEAPPKDRRTVAVRELNAEVLRVRVLVTRARWTAERKGTVESWLAVLGHVGHLEHLLKRKLSVSLDLLGIRK